MSRRLQDEIAKRERFDRERSFALGRSRNETTRLDTVIAEQDRVTTQLSALLDLHFPQYRALARPKPVALADVVASLPSNSAILAPIVMDNRVVSVVVTSRGLSSRSSNISAATVNAAISAVRTAVEPGAIGNGFPVGQAALLHRALFPEAIGNFIGRHADLLYFGGGSLARIPLAVLVDAKPSQAVLKGPALRSVRWLVRDHTVETVGSFSGLIARFQGSRHQTLSTGFAGIGAPVLAVTDSDQSVGRNRLRGGVIAATDLKMLPSLPGAAAELRHLKLKLHRKNNLILAGVEASEQRVKSANLLPYDVIAFATHGVLAGEGGLSEPALVMTPPPLANGDDDGLLTASEASRLRLDADWVILSNCDSAGAGDAGAPPYSGLARAFFQAGARSLLVSMWPVRDDAAERLTVATVVRKKNVTPAHALQTVELATLGDRNLNNSGHPAIWAPFVLISR